MRYFLRELEQRTLSVEERQALRLCRVEMQSARSQAETLLRAIQPAAQNREAIEVQCYSLHQRLAVLSARLDALAACRRGLKRKSRETATRPAVHRPDAAPRGQNSIDSANISKAREKQRRGQTPLLLLTPGMRIDESRAQSLPFVSSRPESVA